MPIDITDIARSSWIVIAAVAAALILARRAEPATEPLPLAVTQELKGLAILLIVFAHIAWMLVSDNRFLYPLSIAAGVGVDLFLFMSGYGLTLGMLRAPLAPLPFYRRRLLRLFIPFWIVLLALLVADGLLLGRTYPLPYVLQSALGWFPRASAWEDVNSPFWYISWVLLFYFLFPLLFSARRPWLSALLIALIANVLAVLDPLALQADWLHRLHTNAFSLGMLLAWGLAARPATGALLVRLRNDGPAPARWLAVGASLALASYAVLHNTPAQWPSLAQLLPRLGLDAGFVIGQGASLVAMGAVLLLFAVKRRSSAFLYLFGVFSYETYLLHWPLMSRYDLFYHALPAWLATLAWLAAFIACGWVLQRVVGPVEALLERRPAAAQARAAPGSPAAP